MISSETQEAFGTSFNKYTREEPAFLQATLHKSLLPRVCTVPYKSFH